MDRAKATVRSAAAMLAAALCLAPAPGGAARPTLYRGEYTLSYLGIGVAQATFDSHIDSDSYAIRGRVSSAGLGAIFDDTRGSLVATGRIARTGPRPESFRAEYKSGRKPGLVDIRFSGGNVTATTVEPPPRKRRDWISLGPEDLRGVADPIAATIIKADGLDRVCDGTVRMYDGELRADLMFSRVSDGEVEIQGYKGRTVTCRLRFEPVSGYRKGKKSLEFLRTKSRIDVAFAPLGETGLYAPIHATVGTEIGTITVRARRFEALR